MNLKFLSIIAVSVIFTSLQGATELAPWGKDADLIYVEIEECEAPKRCSTPFFGAFGEVMIGFHKKVISPADGPRSNFFPNSSQYTLDAMRQYGFFQGVAMGCDRLMRENSDPWVYRKTLNKFGKVTKYNPVP